VKFVVPVFLLSLLPIFAQSPLPDGEGKKETERICNNCHGPENYVRKKHTKDEWETIVDDMVDKGATGTDDDFNIVVRYLTANFGKAKGEREMVRASVFKTQLPRP
jgi:competence protein ComEA